MLRQKTGQVGEDHVVMDPPDTNIPVGWNLNENLVWKTALPGKGHASPIIWETVFL